MVRSTLCARKLIFPNNFSLPNQLPSIASYISFNRSNHATYIRSTSTILWWITKAGSLLFLQNGVSVAVIFWHVQLPKKRVVIPFHLLGNFRYVVSTIDEGRLGWNGYCENRSHWMFVKRISKMFEKYHETSLLSWPRWKFPVKVQAVQWMLFYQRYRRIHKSL